MTPRSPAAAFRYLPPFPALPAWGVAVAGAGLLRHPAHTPYPPPGHPPDHTFAWSRGRVLPAWQLIFLLDGCGEFETRRLPLQPVRAGHALLLSPDTWHRYRPDPATGWTELWVELQGPALAALEQSAVLDPAQPLRDLSTADPTELLHRIHRAALDPSLPPPRRAALGWELLAHLATAHETSAPPPPPIALAIARAEALLAAHLATPPSMPDLARELGVAYSYFRREFRRRTGLSPKAYLQHLRLEKARRLLGATADSLTTLADRLGFHSPYHLSAAFKQAYGLAPTAWRRQHLTKP